MDHDDELPRLPEQPKPGGWFEAGCCVGLVVALVVVLVVIGLLNR